MADIIAMTCQWGRTPIPANQPPQVGYLLIQAQILTPPSRPTPLNFCLVLDHSGSMKGEKLANMKAATKRVVEQLTPNDIVSLVIFDDTVNVVLPATPATDPQTLAAYIDTIDAVGGTAMSLGMQAGYAELQKHHSPNSVSHMLLLTDGQTWGDDDACRTAAKTLSEQNMGITALGLGSEWNEQLLDDLADIIGGTSDYIADPATINTFFHRALKTTQAIAAKDARLLLRLVRDATPRVIHRAAPAITNLGYQPIGTSEVAVRIGDLTYGHESSILLELMLPTRTAGSFRIAQAELHALPLGETQQRVVKQDILLDFSADAIAPAYNPTVMNTVEKVMAFKLQTRALAEAEVGNISGATQKLRAAATRLLDLGELDLAEKTRLQAEQLEQGVSLTPATQKELRYATRRLTHHLEE